MWEIKDNRRAQRYQARIPCSVLLDDEELAGGARRHGALIGHTRNLSLEGLALIVPAIRIGEHDLTGLHQTLRVTLVLPTTEVEFKARLMRYERLHEGATENSYLLGVQIDDISALHRALYNEYINTLR
jgi:hypothetical protein